MGICGAFGFFWCKIITFTWAQLDQGRLLFSAQAVVTAWIDAGRCVQACLGQAFEQILQELNMVLETHFAEKPYLQV